MYLVFFNTSNSNSFLASLRSSVIWCADIKVFESFNNLCNYFTKVLFLKNINTNLKLKP